MIGTLDLNYVGTSSWGVFVVTLVALVIWKFGRIEERFSTPSRPTTAHRFLRVEHEAEWRSARGPAGAPISSAHCEHHGSRSGASANPGGIKDRVALHMIRRARERGDLVDGARIVGSTSGTLGLGLALAGIAYGHPVTVVSDPGMEPIMHRLLGAYGTQVETVDRPCPDGGWQEARRQAVRRLIAEDPTAYCPDQYHNPDNVAAYAPLAHELAEQVGEIDVLVCSVGTGGHSAGISAVLRKHRPGLRLVGVDTVGSTIFGQRARPRLMRGLGSSIHPRNVDYRAFDEVHWVAPEQAVWACWALAATSYTSGGWSVGAVGLVAGWVAGWVARTAAAGTRIVAVFPDGPQRYFDTVYNDDYSPPSRPLVRCTMKRVRQRPHHSKPLR